MGAVARASDTARISVFIVISLLKFVNDCVGFVGNNDNAVQVEDEQIFFCLNVLDSFRITTAALTGETPA